MDQNKTTQGQQQGQQNTQRQPARDQAEGSRDQSGRGNMGGQKRGAGSQKVRNRESGGSSGISNRGMSGREEQEDLPSRGSTGEDSVDQSER